MDDPMNWKHFTVRMVDALRWPAAFVAVALIFREPLAKLLASLAQAVTG